MYCFILNLNSEFKRVLKFNEIRSWICETGKNNMPTELSSILIMRQVINQANGNNFPGGRVSIWNANYYWSRINETNYCSPFWPVGTEQVQFVKYDKIHINCSNFDRRKFSTNGNKLSQMALNLKQIILNNTSLKLEVWKRTRPLKILFLINYLTPRPESDNNRSNTGF